MTDVGAPSFEELIRNGAPPLTIDFTPDRPVLFIAFGGMAARAGRALFELSQVSAGLPINRLFLRDVNRLWYHGGLPGLGANIDGVARSLQKLVARQEPRRVVVFGNSGGGYAAMLFGHLLRADEVHAFAPQVFVSPLRRLLLRDVRRLTRSRMIALFFDCRAQRKYFDLTRVLSAGSGATTHHIHYPTGQRMDRFHAELLRGLKVVILHPYPVAHHGLMRTLRDNGRLRRILLEAMQLPHAA